MKEDSDFGHISSIGGGLCFDAWGAGPFCIVAGGKSFRFEDSDRFGPSLVKKNGDVCANPWPGERSQFWRAHRIWVRQGRRTEDGENCVWDEPQPTIVRKIGRTFFVVSDGEEDGETIVRDDPFAGCLR
jgi:hypothetical protein